MSRRRQHVLAASAFERYDTKRFGPMRYDHKTVEGKWQERWMTSRAFEARDGDLRPKEYLLVEFPYPSGDGLHVGHIRPYVALDVIARKHRMEGKSVLYPIGWDAFGLPTENYAIKKGIHPAVATKQNTDRFRQQIQALGISFDWSREVNTTDPKYYRWTQWIFLQLLKHGLAYKAKMPINWCPSCKIGLANEEATGGVCERCGGTVEKRDREQWMLKITAYAEKLLAGLETVDYIERAKVQQVNWIGRSEGATVTFALRGIPGQEDGKHTVSVFTTRPDTLFGATFLVVSPELAKKWLDVGWKASDAVRAYVASALVGREQDRLDATKEKTGVDSGIRAVNPANGEEIPVWIADYVLGQYGTGAIMAVPAHDERDFAFAQFYTLPIKRVVETPDDAVKKQVSRGSGVGNWVGHPEVFQVTTTQGEWLGQEFHNLGAECYDGAGTLVNSGQFTGMSSEDAKRAITEHVGGKMTVTYKLRDWVFSRQRYWGEPIPIVFCAACTQLQTAHPPVPPLPEGGGETNKNFSPSHWQGERLPAEALAKAGEGVGSGQVSHVKCQVCVIDGIEHAIVPIPEDQLPVLLPEVERYQPTDTGDSPLAAISEFVNTTCPRCGGPAKRETDVMPNWAGSSWYFLAYAMHASLFPKPNVNGVPREASAKWGQWSDVLLKEWMPVDWYNGGMEHTTLHLLYSRFWNIFLHDIGVVPVAEPYAKRTSHGLILAADGEKMSKSRGNVVNPDEIVEKFGADAVRVYEMFIGPFDQPVPWSTDGLVGCRRFLERVVALAERVDPRPVDGTCTMDDRDCHRTIKKVTEDIEAMRFNTAVSALMECVNVLGKRERIPFFTYVTLLTLLSPFAPHLTEELHVRLEAPTPSRSPSQGEGEKIESNFPTSHREGGRGGVGGHSIFNHPWPSHDPAFVVEDEVDLVVQVNGKLRATIRVSADITEFDARERALVEPNVAKYLEGKQPKRVIFVPKRLVNIVV